MAQPKVDVCIVGCGAGGSTMAMRLAEAGLAVVVLEAGARLDPRRDYTNNREEMDRKLSWDIPVTLDVDHATNVMTLKAHSACGVGGGTQHWTCAVGRFDVTDFTTKTADGVGEDWPISYDDLAPFYLMAEKQIGVSTPYPHVQHPCIPRAVNPAHNLSYGSQRIKRGCDKLGITTFPAPIAINSRPYDDRPACNYCGFCASGCMIGANGNAALTHIPRAEAAGAQIRPRCYAREITVDRAGRARSVIYFDPEGHEQEQPADNIVVSCFPVETPRLLLNSKSSLFPDGLANSSGMVGRNLMTHLTTKVTGIFDEPVDAYRGYPEQNLLSLDFYKTDPKRGFVRGFKVTGDAGLEPDEFADLQPSLWGTNLKQHMEMYRHHFTVGALGESLPNDENRVTIDPVVKDKFGVPAARMTHHATERDQKVRAFEFTTLKTILEASGAYKVFHRVKTSGHKMGTCRMGKDPGRSVVDPYGRCHDVRNLFVADGSIFVTGSGFNPTLTIFALANWVAEHMIESLRRA